MKNNSKRTEGRRSKVDSLKSVEADSRKLDPAMEEYARGKKSVGEIAKRHGITPGALTARAKKLGLPLRGRGRWRLKSPTAKHKEIIAFAEKESGQAAALKFGITKQRVSKIVGRWKKKRPSSSDEAKIPRDERKLHVISFRVDDFLFGQLQRELQRNLFKELDSPSEVARELLMLFLFRNRGH